MGKSYWDLIAEISQEYEEIDVQRAEQEICTACGESGHTYRTCHYIDSNEGDR